jgi:hypothetical protein
MSALMQILGQALQGGALEQIGSQAGVSGASAQSAVGLALPVLIEALSRNASTPQGAAALEQAIARDHDGSVLDDIGGLLGAGGGGGAGAAILGHVLGSQQGAVQSRIGQASGLDPQAVGKILTVLAPLVLGALGRTRQQGGGPSLSDVLGGAQAHVQRQAPGGVFAQLLDRNHDGSAVDDVARLGMGLLGGLLGGKK